MRKHLLSLVFIISTALVKAQDKDSYFALRAGYLYSITSIEQAPSSLLLMPDIGSKGGFYAGVFYTKKISNLFLSRIGINYQNKGGAIQGIYNGIVEKRIYNCNYASLDPLIGISLPKYFSLFVGSEINLSLNKTSDGQNIQPVEFGLIARSTYKYRKLMLELGYFKGINSYIKTNEKDPTFKYFNQNWQIGLGYAL